jgi:hypothetical protein
VEEAEGVDRLIGRKVIAAGVTPGGIFFDAGVDLGTPEARFEILEAELGADHDRNHSQKAEGQLRQFWRDDRSVAFRLGRQCPLMAPFSICWRRSTHSIDRGK